MLLHCTQHLAVALLGKPHAGFVTVAKDWGLIVSTAKTKGMVVGQSVDENDVSPVQVDEGTFDIVDQFTYLGAAISRDGEVTTEVDTRIAKVARAFGCPRKPIFQDRNLSIATTDKSLLDVIIEHQLRWLGHLGRMEKNRLPKRVLFGELEKKRPFHGTKRRWRDVVIVDVEAIRVGEGWYNSC